MRSRWPSRACGTSSCRAGPCERGSTWSPRRGPTAPRATRAGTARSSRAVSGGRASRLSRHLDGVEPRLGPVDMDAGNLAAVLVDPGAGAGALDLGDAVEGAEIEDAVADRELRPVERPHGRPGDSVPLGVVLATVARATEAGHEHRCDLHLVLADRLLPILIDETVRLNRAPEMGAARVEGREGGHILLDAVVADEHRSPRHLADLRILEIGRDRELPLGEGLDRA